MNSGKINPHLAREGRGGCHHGQWPWVDESMGTIKKKAIYYGISMEYLGNIYGIPREYLWNSFEISMEYLWNIYGISMEYL